MAKTVWESILADRSDRGWVRITNPSPWPRSGLPSRESIAPEGLRSAMPLPLRTRSTTPFAPFGEAENRRLGNRVVAGRDQ
jgi:hypothetical protein